MIPINSDEKAKLIQDLTDIVSSVKVTFGDAIEMEHIPPLVREHTLEEIGKELGVTRERVRQIEAKAIRKLQHISRKKVLESYNDP